jgi:hypothetical protein
MGEGNEKVCQATGYLVHNHEKTEIMRDVVPLELLDGAQPRTRGRVPALGERGTSGWAAH